jgi:hypothetical protein
LHGVISIGITLVTGADKEYECYRNNDQKIPESFFVEIQVGQSFVGVDQMSATIVNNCSFAHDSSFGFCLCIRQKPCRISIYYTNTEGDLMKGQNT